MEDPGHRLQRAVARIKENTHGRLPTGLRHDDADGDVGSIASDHAIGFDPLPVLRAFSDVGARVIVIGQVAGILHGSEELTGDLDLLWSGSPDDAGPIARSFDALRARVENAEGKAVTDVGVALRLPKLLFETDTAAGDCCTPNLPFGLDVAPFLHRAATVDVDGAIIHYLTADDLVLMRRAAGRPKDLRRIEELHRIRALD